RVKVRQARAEADYIQDFGLHLLGFGIDGQRQRWRERGGALGDSVIQDHKSRKQIAASMRRRKCNSVDCEPAGSLTLPPLKGCSPSPREGRAGRGAIRTGLLIIGFPLSLTLPTPSSWGEGIISGALMVVVSLDPSRRFLVISMTSRKDRAQAGIRGPAGGATNCRPLVVSWRSVCADSPAFLPAARPGHRL